MAPSRWFFVALGTTLLVLLGWGTLTLGFAKAGHTTVRQHMAAEAGQEPRPVQGPADVGAVLDRHDTAGEHGRAHVEHGFHLLGACAAVLAAAFAVVLRRPIGERGDATAAGRGSWHRAAWSAGAAPPGLGPPARTALCVQLC